MKMEGRGHLERMEGVYMLIEKKCGGGKEENVLEGGLAELGASVVFVFPCSLVKPLVVTAFGTCSLKT